MKKPKLSDFTAGVHQIEHAQAVQKYQKALEDYVEYLKVEINTSEMRYLSAVEGRSNFRKMHMKSKKELLDLIIKIKSLEDPKNQETKFTIKALSHALKDPEYRLGWVANIAMAYLDNQRWYREKNGIKGNQMSYKNRHAIANQAAEYFLDQLTKDRS